MSGFSCIGMTVRKLYMVVQKREVHCVKSARIGSYSGPAFFLFFQYIPAFGLNTERYGVSQHIQSKCRKTRTRITPNSDSSYAVVEL